MKTCLKTLFTLTLICCISTFFTTCKSDDDCCCDSGNYINNTKIEGLTYIYNGNYEGQSADLIKRVSNKTTSLYDNNLVNIIIDGNIIDSTFTISNIIPIGLLISKGGNVVITNPNMNMLKNITQAIQSIIDLYINNSSIYNNNLQSIDENTSPSDNIDINQILNYISNIDLSLLDNFDSDLAFIGIRKNSLYCLSNINNNEPRSIIIDYEKSYVTGTDSILSFVIENETIKSDYVSGNELGRITQWMNEID